MSPTPTKSEELAALRAFVDSLPRNSYLAEIFRDAVPVVDGWIRSDLAFPVGQTMTQIRTWHEHARTELEDVRAQVADATRERRDIERARDRARAELAELQGCARQILRIPAPAA